VDTLVHIQGNIVKNTPHDSLQYLFKQNMARGNKSPSVLQFYVYIAYISFSLRTYDNFRPLDFCWTAYKKKLYQFTRLEQKAPGTVRCTVHPKILGPRYRTCCTSRFWRLEFSGVSWICGESSDS